ncbi:helix-turn-helix domain-containing protein [Mycobacteroides abscessus]|uniref:helix-turn-helix domain-containing protein n=1 Tax=Mycobacteroides abscessus TaxID=36809 RepID=UPI0009A87F60|nr:helix-turn-helix domain-containing protein [Mycobacteroides abscessus]SKT02294.1 Transposase and inactivated derivatives [Mycobacteroides abscessus subsp. massiliense]SKT48845.1 Transposase and inactivated derivatives [Mycobacteroides abscessus subsp. massiliense]
MVRVLHSYCNHESAAQRLAKVIDQARNGDRPPRTAPLPQSAKQFRPEQVTEILAAWDETHNVAAIARQLELDYGTIRKYLKAAGIDTAWRSRLNPRDHEIIRLHLEGKSTRQIAKAVGCSNNKAWTTIRDYKAAQAAAES